MYDKLSDLNDLIEQIISEQSADGSSRVYSDEPILKRASQLKKNNVPEKIREMKKIAQSREAFWKTSSWLFYQQGTFMADYTDDCEYKGNVDVFLPSYSDLNTHQLRGYFSWRTKFRNGVLSPAPEEFLVLYAQEVINQIGISSPEEGFRLLNRLYQEYRIYQAPIKEWIADYAVYYDLPKEYFSQCAEFENDRFITAFADYAKTDDDALYEAICHMSSYNIGISKFCRQYPREYKETIVRVIRSLSEYAAKHRKKTLCESFFGKSTIRMYRMFEYMPVYESERHKQVTVQVNPVRQYICNKNGLWDIVKYENDRASSQLGIIAKETDRIMREIFGFKNALKETDIPKITLKLIRNEVNAVYEEHKKASEREKIKEVVIDVSQFSRIRSDADFVRDKLIVEEEPELLPETEKIPDPAAETAGENSQSLLTAAEKGFVLALLAGDDVKAYAAGTGILPSVLADGVNEKLFDIFADNVVDFDGDVPCIPEDYADDVKEMSENGEL